MQQPPPRNMNDASIQDGVHLTPLATELFLITFKGLLNCLLLMEGPSVPFLCNINFKSVLGTFMSSEKRHIDCLNRNSRQSTAMKWGFAAGQKPNTQN
jgi:hypothetical protein